MEENLEHGFDAGAESGDTGGVYDVDSIADLLVGEDGGEDAEEQYEGEGVDNEADAVTEEPAEGEAEEDPHPDTVPGVPMPEGWEDAMWQGLSPEVRSAVHAREQAHAQAMAQVQAEQQAAKQKQEQFAIAANAQLQQALATMKQIVEGEYSGVDWNSLAQSDPATYIKLQQAYNARMGAIQRIQQGVAQQVKQYEAARAQDAQKSIAAEFAQVQPEIKALIGAGFDGKTFAADMAQYMASQGCPAQVINGLSKGYEVKLIAKAMLFDKMMANRAAAAKKVAEAPKVQAPRGAVPADNSRAAKARALLTKNPDSTDALAAVFEAM